MLFPINFRDSKITRNRRTDHGRTDRPSYRDAWTHLKTHKLTDTHTWGTMLFCYHIGKLFHVMSQPKFVKDVSWCDWGKNSHRWPKGVVIVVVAIVVVVNVVLFILSINQSINLILFRSCIFGAVWHQVLAPPPIRSIPDAVCVSQFCISWKYSALIASVEGGNSFILFRMRLITF